MTTEPNLVYAFVFGALVSMGIVYFVARKHQQKVMELLNYNLKGDLDKLRNKLDGLKDDVKEELKEIVDNLQDKLNKK